VIVLAAWAGSAADRYNRRQLLFVTQTMAALLAATLAVLAWSGVPRA
jgi:hypothetical protein